MRIKDYVSPEVIIKVFADEDVITASLVAETRDPDAPIELPFVPAQ